MKHLFSARHELKAEDTETDKIQIPVIKEFVILCGEALAIHHRTLKCLWHRTGETEECRPSIKPNKLKSMFCQFSITYNAVNCLFKAQVLVILQRENCSYL